MYFMEQAFKQARLASRLGEVPVGCVIVKDGSIIATGYNQRETNKDVTAHAEIIAIRAANAFVDNWRLTGCSIYVTLEPCPMCAGAIVASRPARLYFSAFAHDDQTIYHNTGIEVYCGIMQSIGQQLISCRGDEAFWRTM